MALVLESGLSLILIELANITACVSNGPRAKRGSGYCKTLSSLNSVALNWPRKRSLDLHSHPKDSGREILWMAVLNSFQSHPANSVPLRLKANVWRQVKLAANALAHSQQHNPSIIKIITICLNFNEACSYSLEMQKSVPRKDWL